VCVVDGEWVQEVQVTGRFQYLLNRDNHQGLHRCYETHACGEQQYIPMGLLDGFQGSLVDARGPNK